VLSLELLSITKTSARAPILDNIEWGILEMTESIASDSLKQGITTATLKTSFVSVIENSDT